MLQNIPGTSPNISLSLSSVQIHVFLTVHVPYHGSTGLLMQGSILPVTIPPGHTPRDLQFFSYLAVYSAPPGMQKETVPHPRTPHRPEIRCFVFKIDLYTIAQPAVLTRT